MPYLLSNSYFVEEIYQFPASIDPGPNPNGNYSVYTKVMYSSLNDNIVGVAFGFYIPIIMSQWPAERKAWLYLLLCLYTYFNGAAPDLRTMSLQAILINCINNAQTSGRRATINIIWSNVLPGARQT